MRQLHINIIGIKHNEIGIVQEHIFAMTCQTNCGAGSNVLLVKRNHQHPVSMTGISPQVTSGTFFLDISDWLYGDVDFIRIRVSLRPAIIQHSQTRSINNFFVHAF